ncbi:polyketide synthase [Paraburkholderia humisilvae]|uniref:Polyketide biosynthesis enoyl-CoA isomerase PksI n=1 Tax=Paraburkholderia humisilvae TaxID=627669 RepID=A0A6J5EHS8_9BURK|nr:polyketide synthase [Paraburkholderia humisilvae]CAB3765803.1 Putative polyketide biosynthesis enoyl-CoA isomerase PksI [Paraburkholderia humisilvae]
MTSSPIVAITEPAAGVALVTMQDRIHKNAFTDALIAELTRAFAALGTRADLKTVVLTGYDNYFSSGGTQEGLRDLFDGKFVFTDRDLYSVALNCPIPVIAAMQGHGIGGGFVMGLFADIVILARESVYTANFMRYGFTPGMGSTFIVPEKLGIALAGEMMLSAANYRGEELQRRGVPFAVLPRDQVLMHALELARSLAQKPRMSLVALKDHLAAPLRQKLPAFIEQEVALHALTFQQPEVRERIETLFGQ